MAAFASYILQLIRLMTYSNNYKELLDKFFMTSRIIKFEVEEKFLC